MDAATLDQVLLAKLLAEVAQGLEAIAAELCPLYDGWAAAGVDPATLSWMWGVLERLGFWSRRLELAADPDLVDLFPSLD